MTRLLKRILLLVARPSNPDMDVMDSKDVEKEEPADIVPAGNSKRTNQGSTTLL